MMKTNIVLLCLLALVMAAPAVVAQTPFDSDVHRFDHIDPEDQYTDSIDWEMAKNQPREDIPLPFWIGTEPLRWICNDGGSAAVIMEVEACFSFEYLTLEVVETHNLIYNGERKREFEWTPGFRFVDTLEMVVPARDTCWMLITATTDRRHHSVWVGWVPWGKGHFRYNRDNPALLRIPKRVRQMEPFVEPIDTFSGPREMHSWLDENGDTVISDTGPAPIRKKSALEEAAAKKGWDWKPGDTTIGFRQDASGEWEAVLLADERAQHKEQERQRRNDERRQLMHEKEKTPLTERPYEMMWIDHVCYRRDSGEYQFHVIEPIRDFHAHGLAFRDSLKMANGVDHDLVLDLRDPVNYARACELIDSLVCIDSAGYYRVSVKWPVKMLLDSAGIENHSVGWQPKPGEGPAEYWPQTEKKSPRP